MSTDRSTDRDDVALGTGATAPSTPSADPSTEQERLIAEHEATHGPLPQRILSELRAGTEKGRAAGAKAVGTLGAAAEALHLEVVQTSLAGERSLVGHVLGMRLLIPAEGIHGPREAPALLYLFRDGLGIRPTDDAPMSAVPLVGLHIVMPHVAVARWAYRAGRTAHANVDLAKQETDFVASLSSWTIDDFKKADDKLDVVKTADLAGPVHLYQHLGLVRLALPVAGRPPVRLKSALPESAGAYVHMWELFGKVSWPSGLTMDKPPAGDHDDPAEG